MECNYCSYPETRVVSTREHYELKQVYRRRECIKCGCRFTTREHFRDNYKRPLLPTIPPKKVLPK